jgi:hypothetical protein
VKPSVLGIYLYISAIIILVYNTRLEYHCMHEHVRSTACSICVRSSGMGETARAGTGCVRPAGKKRRHNGTSWRHVIIFGDPFLTCAAADDLLGLPCIAYRPASYRPLIFDQQEQARVLQILLYGRWTGSRSACPLGSHVSFIRYLLLNKYIY